MAEVENRRVKITKQMLKAALTELLECKDIYHISVRELCEAADINRSTFYKYYSGQFELLTDMENDMLIMVKETLTRNMGRREQIIEDACRYLEDNLKLARLLVNNNVDPAFPEKLFSMTYLRETVAKFCDRSYDSRTNEYFYEFMTYGAYQMIRTWLNKEDREKPREFAEMLIKIVT